MAGIKWETTSREISEEGTTITYSGVGTHLTIESRKRHIQHANRSGTWDYTSYFVLFDDVELIEKNTLKEAKEYAEKQIQED